MMSRSPIELDSFYHVYNRGVDKRKVFFEKTDYLLFLRFMNVLNNVEIVNPSRLSGDVVVNATERLVDLCAFCLMPNHFHFLVHERREGGISKFMQRLGTAYTLYFNEKYDRSGALFQGKYKYKIVEDEAYLFSLIHYLHINPKDLVPGYNKESGTPFRKVLTFLDTYSWSSYHDYCGQPKYAHLLQRTVLDDFIEPIKDYRANLNDLYGEDYGALEDSLAGLLFD